MPACDACGSCVVACPSGKLSRGLLQIGVALVLLILLPGQALAHHNKGLPHYGYFENYPQLPVEEYVAIDGPWEIGAVIYNFQGYDRREADTPNDVKIYLYLYDSRTKNAYTGPLDVELPEGRGAEGAPIQKLQLRSGRSRTSSPRRGLTALPKSS